MQWPTEQELANAARDYGIQNRFLARKIAREALEEATRIATLAAFNILRQLINSQQDKGG
ncbi:hypothetical protein SAMN00768000_3084 [Sulfobacillus thermosulfidooxidans DSM 9293]|uniref:Uncharacterized protein n=2 Tax=Sulfobacillus thermosulfidooxidans TaxID=28034 RepID=A0A1W1WKY8_SULTA|nr:hypothetical protein [Sulfobacillus thermosulfidooxidans]PSR21713.1 MAG: hypothetical protein C7B47_17165 [Sulfobacillus thermosulfidooxidans]SMC06895.1 hypothetical protein SAMN00768000_3084 [Sulfobacillus thermosulfidooxidans DSM 9293]